MIQKASDIITLIELQNKKQKASDSRLLIEANICSKTIIYAIQWNYINLICYWKRKITSQQKRNLKNFKHMHDRWWVKIFELRACKTDLVLLLSFGESHQIVILTCICDRLLNYVDKNEACVFLLLLLHLILFCVVLVSRIRWIAIEY